MIRKNGNKGCFFLFVHEIFQKAEKRKLRNDFRFFRLFSFFQ